MIVQDGEIVGEGFNRPVGSHDPTAHAEIEALRSASSKLGNYRLTGSTLYVTIEPCTMCAGALVHARVARLVYGAAEPRSGAVHSTARVLDNPALNHQVTVTAGVLADAAAGMLRRFFRDRRTQPQLGARDA